MSKLHVSMFSASSTPASICNLFFQLFTDEKCRIGEGRRDLEPFHNQLDGASEWQLFQGYRQAGVQTNPTRGEVHGPAVLILAHRTFADQPHRIHILPLVTELGRAVQNQDKISSWGQPRSSCFKLIAQGRGLRPLRLRREKIRTKCIKEFVHAIALRPERVTRPARVSWQCKAGQQ